MLGWQCRAGTAGESSGRRSRGHRRGEGRCWEGRPENWARKARGGAGGGKKVQYGEGGEQRRGGKGRFEGEGKDFAIASR